MFFSSLKNGVWTVTILFFSVEGWIVTEGWTVQPSELRVEWLDLRDETNIFLRDETLRDGQNWGSKRWGMDRTEGRKVEGQNNWGRSDWGTDRGGTDHHGTGSGYLVSTYKELFYQKSCFPPNELVALLYFIDIRFVIKFYIKCIFMLSIVIKMKK